MPVTRVVSIFEIAHLGLEGSIGIMRKAIPCIIYLCITFYGSYSHYCIPTSIMHLYAFVETTYQTCVMLVQLQ